MNVVFWEYVSSDFFAVITTSCSVSRTIAALAGLHFPGSFVGTKYNHNRLLSAIEYLLLIFKLSLIALFFVRSRRWEEIKTMSQTMTNIGYNSSTYFRTSTCIWFSLPHRTCPLVLKLNKTGPICVPSPR